MEPFDKRTGEKICGSKLLDAWCRGEGWAVDGLVILRVDNKMCGAVGVSDGGNICRRFCV